MTELDTVPSKISWVQMKIEAKIILAIQKIISGEEFTEDFLKQAQIIEQKVSELKLLQMEKEFKMDEARK